MVAIIRGKNKKKPKEKTPENLLIQAELLLEKWIRNTDISTIADQVKEGDNENEACQKSFEEIMIMANKARQVMKENGEIMAKIIHILSKHQTIKERGKWREIFTHHGLRILKPFGLLLFYHDQFC